MESSYMRFDALEPDPMADAPAQENDAALDAFAERGTLVQARFLLKNMRNLRGLAERSPDPKTLPRWEHYVRRLEGIVAAKGGA